jgi:Fe-S cluster assembly protein SufD
MHMFDSHATVDWYRSQFASYERTLNGDAASVLHGMRRAALEHFADLGFPTMRDEEWRFTNVAQIAQTAFVPAAPESISRVTEADITPHLLARVHGPRMVFVNGFWAPSLSSIDGLPAGVRVESLAVVGRHREAELLPHLGRVAPMDSNAFTALQTAFFRDGAFLAVSDSVEMQEPVHLLFLSTEEPMPFAAFPRNLIIAGERSRVAVVESHIGLGSGVYMTNTLTEVLVGVGAVVEHDKLQNESSRAFHIGSTCIRQGEKSQVTSNSIALGGLLVRNNVTALFSAECAETTLNGLSLGTGEQLIDNHTTIDHAAPNCLSRELYKSILDGNARGVFNGKIFVRKDAQKTDARQTNRTLLLSDGATIDTKPQLEIFADDVKCTHGATVGQLDEDQVFYLRARGIDETAARDILTFAFAADVVEKIHIESLRDHLKALLQMRLGQGRSTTLRP